MLREYIKFAQASLGRMDQPSDSGNARAFANSLFDVIFEDLPNLKEMKY